MPETARGAFTLNSHRMMFRIILTSRVSAAVFGLALLGNVSSAGATVYDLEAQWSDANNPNGPWTYREDLSALPLVANWGPGQFPDGRRYLAVCLGSVRMSQATFCQDGLRLSQLRTISGLDWQRGDIIVHTTDSSNGVGEGLANVLFTSPVAGPVTISGDVWSARTSLSRANDWSLLVNGVAKASGLLTGTTATDRTNPEKFSVPGVTLKPNDTVELVFQEVSTGDAGDYVGVNLTINTAGTVTGDPHFTTYDGRHYSMQAGGDFELTRSTVRGDSFDVDIRTRPSQNHGVPVSLISEVGADLGDHRVTFDVDRAKAGDSFVWIDGRSASLSLDNPFLILDGGSIIELSPTSYRVIWNTGEILDITNHGSYLDVASSLSPADGPGSVEGLLGSASGQNSDFRLPNGAILDPHISPSDLDGVFADAWRVTDATSLLDYGPGQTTATFTDQSFPSAAAEPAKPTLTRPATTAVPEPGPLTLLGVGLAALGLIRRRAPKPS